MTFPKSTGFIIDELWLECLIESENLSFCLHWDPAISGLIPRFYDRETIFSFTTVRDQFRKLLRNCFTVITLLSSPLTPKCCILINLNIYCNQLYGIRLNELKIYNYNFFFILSLRKNQTTNLTINGTNQSLIEYIYYQFIITLLLIFHLAKSATINYHIQPSYNCHSNN